MRQEYSLRRLRHLLEPVHDLSLIGMRTKISEREHLRGHRQFLPKDDRRFGAIDKLSPERFFGLITGKEDGRIGLANSVRQMVHNTAAGRHAAGADNDGG